MGRLQRPTGDDEKVAGRGRKAAHSRLNEIHDFLAKGLSPLVRNLLKRRVGEIVFRTTTPMNTDNTELLSALIGVNRRPISSSSTERDHPVHQGTVECGALIPPKPGK